MNITSNQFWVAKGAQRCDDADLRDGQRSALFFRWGTDGRLQP